VHADWPKSLENNGSGGPLHVAAMSFGGLISQLVPYQPTFARSLPAVALGSLEDEEQEAQEGRP
jgi:hypothetical protein